MTEPESAPDSIDFEVVYDSESESDSDMIEFDFDDTYGDDTDDVDAVKIFMVVVLPGQK